MDLAEPLTLPAAPDPPRRPPVPLLAALVPVAAGIVLWLVTGSLLALCFAAFGPLMMIASVADGGRQRRREQRRATSDAAAQWESVETAVAGRHRVEREKLWLRHPGLRDLLAETPLHEQGFGPETPVVLGSGEVASRVRVSGGDGERAERFRERAARLADAPVVLPLGGGIAVRGPLPVAGAVARSLLVQLCARFPPGQLTLVGDGAAALGLAGLPHEHAAGAERSLAVSFGGRGEARADAVLCVVGTGEEVPEAVSTVIDCARLGRAQVRSSTGIRSVALDALSAAQADIIARAWAADAGGAIVPQSLRLEELALPEPAAGLPVAVGRGEGGDAVVDLVTDGPHAIVTGTTGSGKSELLITWITALARAYPAERVAFVLADFKGGTAFLPLRTLPHVAAVITDLDESGAARGVTSLRAELRRREEVLAAAGARDVGEPGVALPRLVIVVDEFAALIHEHPDLAEVFTDIAARGRALGMHLILGTQRAAGVIREGLAANCPLRLSLRVTDAGDSRMLLGTEEAARLPGDAASRGLAVLRRPQDDAARRLRVALTTTDAVEQVRAARAGEPRARSPWLPALPERIALDDLPVSGGGALLGLADEPARQRQEPVSLRCGADRGIAILGGPQSGKTGVLALLRAQEPDTLLLGPDPEQAWDAVTALAAGERAPALVLCDDLDALATRFPVEYAPAFAERVEQAVRQATAAGGTVVISAARVTSLVSRVTDLLPQRALLALPSRADHLAAGGSADTYLARRGPGRAHLGGREVQFALAPEPLAVPATTTRAWAPGRLTAVVTPQPLRLAEQLRAALPGATVRLALDESSDAASDPTPLVLVGDGEAWQRQWSLWQRLRSEGDVVLAAECTTELRTLVGMRELPPYARMHAGRAWLFTAGASPQRVVLPGGGLRR